MSIRTTEESRLRKPRLGLALALVSVLLGATFASRAANAEPPVFTDNDGVAIRGYDPVAYFEDGRPVPGTEQWGYRWRGAVWRFASKEHRDAFRDDPERYAPQYGGFCSYAMSFGKQAPIDPQAWDVVDGRLFLNKSPGIRRDWLKNRDERIVDADRHWAEIVEQENP